MTTLDSEEVILEGVLEQKGVLLEGGVGEGDSAGLLGPDTEASEREGGRVKKGGRRGDPRRKVLKCTICWV